MADDNIAIIRKQEEALTFDRFDETEAFALGMALHRRASESGMPLVIEVRSWDRLLFFAALPGSSSNNANWVRRKINVVKMFHKSSYRMTLEQDRPDGTLPPRYGLDPADYALAGGGFPIKVAGVGIIGAVAVSGLPQRDDHELVVEALCERLGRTHGELALPVVGS
jgi:uncharacterized protein (UPF0303 family)